MEGPRIEAISQLKPLRKLQFSDCPADEPTLVGARCDFVRARAGKVVNEFTDRVVEQGWGEGSFLIFVYNKRLFPGSWPISAPNWHVDGQTGTDITYPNRKRAETLMCSYTYDGSEEGTGTEFALGDVCLQSPPDAKPFQSYKYPWWHPQIEEQIKKGELTTQQLRNLDLNYFDDEAFHRTPWVTKTGSRILMSAFRFIDPRSKPLGNTTVYDTKNLAYIPLPDGSGWQPIQMAA